MKKYIITKDLPHFFEDNEDFESFDNMVKNLVVAVSFRVDNGIPHMDECGIFHRDPMLGLGLFHTMHGKT